jgi:hypothetical protein
LVSFTLINAQNKIVLKGKVMDETKSAVIFPVIANKTKNTGMMANPDGTFQMMIDKSDTILVSSIGYFLQKICLKDSSITKYLFEKEYSDFKRSNCI